MLVINQQKEKYMNMNVSGMSFKARNFQPPKPTIPSDDEVLSRHTSPDGRFTTLRTAEGFTTVDNTKGRLYEKVVVSPQRVQTYFNPNNKA